MNYMFRRKIKKLPKSQSLIDYTPSTFDYIYESICKQLLLEDSNNFPVSKGLLDDIDKQIKWAIGSNKDLVKRYSIDDIIDLTKSNQWRFLDQFKQCVNYIKTHNMKLNLWIIFTNCKNKQIFFDVLKNNTNINTEKIESMFAELNSKRNAYTSFTDYQNDIYVFIHSGIEYTYIRSIVEHELNHYLQRVLNIDSITKRGLWREDNVKLLSKLTEDQRLFCYKLFINLNNKENYDYLKYIFSSREFEPHITDTNNILEIEYRKYLKTNKFVDNMLLREQWLNNFLISIESDDYVGSKIMFNHTKNIHLFGVIRFLLLIKNIWDINCSEKRYNYIIDCLREHFKDFKIE